MRDRKRSAAGRQAGLTFVGYALSGAAMGAAVLALLQVYRPEVARLSATALELLRSLVTG